MSFHRSRSFRQITHALIVVASLMIVIVAGCSTGNNQQIFDPDTGKHPANWVTNHGVTFLTDPGLCIECHGDDLRGGISAVSCYSTTFNGISCHPNGPGGHPAGWATPTTHGPSAKSAPNAAAMHGFSTCQICHGTTFTGGYVNTACASCHGGSAPHPLSWITGTYTHTNTDSGNASVCALCHAGGANSPIPAPSSPPAGTAPGCFNGTLCHAAAGHTAGWASPVVHGPSAKAAPNAAAMQGFSTCQPCHGNTFGGNATHPSCSSCHSHGVPTMTAPHPASWITGSYTHTNTNTLNAAACSLCHSAGANSPTAPPTPPAPGTPPDCFNGTLCHTQMACGSCHGIPPDGTTAPNIAGRHTQHISVNPGIVTCSTCHNGAGSGTGLHQNGTVNVIFDPAYNAKSGTATYNAGSNTCSNIGCHGSSRTQTQQQAAARQSTPGATPVWLSGTIDVNTQCTLCHVLGPSSGNPENNSYYSGQHYLHVWDPNNGPQPKLACTACHDTAKLAPVHFTSLTAPLSAATASSTLRNTLRFTGTGCTPSCHGNESW